MIKPKNAILLLLLFFGNSLLWGAFTYFKAKEKIFLQSTEKLKIIANSAVIHFPKKEFIKTKKKLEEGTDAHTEEALHLESSKVLQKIKHLNQLTQDIYTFYIPNDKPHTMRLVSMSGNKNFSGNYMNASKVVKQAYAEKINAFSKAYQNSEGYWVSAAIPIISASKVEGVIKVDYSIKKEMGLAYNEAIIEIIYIFCLTLFITSIFILLARKKLMQQKKNLSKVNKILLSARQDAIKLSDMKTQFLANMSHEIRTPLNGIIGILNLMGKTKLDTQQKEYVSIVENAGKHLLSVINEVLEMSRIEAGKIEIKNSPFNLRKCIEETVEVLAYSIYEKDIEVPIRIDENIGQNFLGDEYRIKQVITNILGNAIKFTEQGNIIINAYRKKDILIIKIKDTGIGIPPDKIKSIFDKFSQVDISDTRVFGGTGLGLPISKKIINTMDGEISVSSELGKGSEFTIQLPVLEEIKDSNSQAVKLASKNIGLLVKNNLICENLEQRFLDWNLAPHVLSPNNLPHQLESFDFIFIDEYYMINQSSSISEFIHSIPKEKRVLLVSPNNKYSISEEDLDASICLYKPIKLSNLLELFSNEEEKILTNLQTNNKAKNSEKKILIVEDNFVNQIVITATLDSLSYSYDLVENGQLAVERCQNEEYGLILMDCQMPVMDGYSATEKIRTEENSMNSQTPILAMTANAFDSAKKKCINSGMNSVIAKPFEEANLVEVIEHFIAA